MTLPLSSTLVNVIALVENYAITFVCLFKEWARYPLTTFALCRMIC